MLSWLFLLMAAFGGCLLIAQFLLGLLGMGGDFGLLEDLPHDVGHDVAGAHGSIADPDLSDQGVGHGNLSTWIFSILSLKTLTAAVAFFGLAGCAAVAAHLSMAKQIGVATAAGMSAMLLVHWLMRSLARLSQDNTLRIDHAIGMFGTVYLTVPANRSGLGKIHFQLQGRLVEYAALTNHDEALTPGSRVQIVAAVTGKSLEVEPAVEPKPSDIEA